jgi:hypothetical protein
MVCYHVGFPYQYRRSPVAALLPFAMVCYPAWPQNWAQSEHVQINMFVDATATRLRIVAADILSPFACETNPSEGDPPQGASIEKCRATPPALRGP